MKSLASLFAAAVLLFVTACSTLKTEADYDRNTDFSKFRTFAFKDVRPLGNDLVERRIKAALERELTARGLRREEGNPDLWVVPHVRLSEELEVRTYDTGWGYGWRWRRGIGTSVSRVEKVPVGTLIVDLVDAKENEMVWRGTATDTLKRGATPAEREEALSEAIAKMLAAYPPKST